MIELKSITNATNSITVEVTTKRNEGGKIEYYIKGPDDADYILKETITDTSYTYSGLEQNKKYNIKIIAIAENKQTAEVLVDRTTGNVPDLTEADITFTYLVDGKEIDKETWTNKNVTVTASTTVTGYTLQTSKDGKEWSSETSQTFTENGKMYVVLYDGTNYGGSASGIKKYQISSDNANWTDISGNKYIFNTKGAYTRYFRAIDNAGNISSSSSKKFTIYSIDSSITLSKYTGRTITLLGSLPVPVYENAVNIVPNNKYEVQFDYMCASGTNKFNCDLYPDDLPEIHQVATTAKQHVIWILTSSSANMSNCKLRFFDNIQEESESDITNSYKN